jgi:photosystem II stability/assembly factor-like uncharacterized protein
MPPTSTNAVRPGRCARCGAPLAADDRFCAVCGSLRAPAAPPSGRRRRARGLLVGSAAVLLAVFAAVAWIYFSAPERQAAQPVGQLPTAPTALGLAGAPDHVALAAVGGRLLASADQGVTWQPVALSGTVRAVTFAAAGSPAYLAGSAWWTGEGNQFSASSAAPALVTVRALAGDGADPRRIYALTGPANTSATSLYRSDDAGQHWQLLGADAPGDADSLALVGPTNPIIFVGTAGHGVFASQDGRTWTNASGFVNGALPTRTITAIAFDPQSGDRFVGPTGQAFTGALYVGTDRGVYKSIDQGISWSTLGFQQPVAALAAAPDGSRLLLVADPAGRVYRSTDGGVSWNG